MLEEIWKDIPGYKDYYQVSNMGRVRSLSRTINMSHGGKYPVRGRILKPILKKDTGYYVVGLTKNGLRQASIHSLVALCFIGPPPDGCHTHHKDGNRKNNNADNLIYLTPTEHNGGSNNGMAKYSIEQFEEAKRLYLTRRYAIPDIANMTGIHVSALYGALYYDRWGTEIKLSDSEKWDARVILHRGENNSMAKLTDDTVREIRRSYIPGEYGAQKIGKKYGVSKTTIKRILSRKSWKHID